MGLMNIIDKFVNRLNRIGIEVTLIGNYPWVYMDTVNNKQIKENFQANHGYTVFFMPIDNKQKVRFSDRRTVFRKIRTML
jgi:hypothetical protein